MPQHAAVEAVVFDVGEVIVQWDRRCLFSKLIGDPEELDWFLDHVVTEGWHYQHDAGRSLSETIPERQALFPQYASEIEAYATRFVETLPGRVPGTADLIERLAANAVPLFAITNFGAEFWKQYAPFEPVLNLMRDVVVSGEEKIVKPDPAIYRLAADRFGFSPSAMLFIDDRQHNIDAARREGWQTHLFEGADALEAALRDYGLLEKA